MIRNARILPTWPEMRQDRTGSVMVMGVMADAWASVAEPWRAALSEAWTAYTRGTIPVGAAIVDPQGTLAAVGRNRIYDEATPSAVQLSGTWVAHAELNAILQLDARRTTGSQGWCIYTTLEPCPLCLGAMTVAFRGTIKVAYAVTDPVGGAIGARESTDLGRQRRWEIDTLAGPLATLAELLIGAHSQTREPQSRTAQLFAASSWLGLLSEAVPLLSEAAARGETVDSLVDALEDALGDFAPLSVMGQASR